VLDSVDDLRAVTGNLGFTVCLYAGQMCTASQNIFIPKDGIDVGGTNMSFDDVAGAFVKAIDWWMGDPGRAVEVLGAIQNPATVERIAAAKEEAIAAGGRVLRESAPVPHEHFPEARIHTPLVIGLDASNADQFAREMFGPIVYVIATDGTDQSVALASGVARDLGAITASVYSTDDAVLESATDALTAAGAAVSCNLTGQIWVNQSAAFSDFHVSGANPAGNATLTDGAFVASRFNVVQSRVLVPQPAEAEAHAGV
ncbi:MAG: aldehyde dehydrogenase family protein, partial [Planctomycetota bacterium]|jgi:phenylacetic acid degradation protein paaN